MQDVATIFSRNLKELRVKNGMSQTELANKIGVSRGAISYYETKERLPDIVTLGKIAELFDVSSDYLIGLSEIPTVDLSVSYMASTLGLTQKTIDDLSSYAKLAKESCRSQEYLKQKLSTLNYIVSGSELLDRITTYLHFNATHFKNFYDEDSDTLAPIGELELWDSHSKNSYSDDWDLWSNALLLQVQQELIWKRQNLQKERFNKIETLPSEITSK